MQLAAAAAALRETSSEALGLWAIREVAQEAAEEARKGLDGAKLGLQARLVHERAADAAVEHSRGDFTKVIVVQTLIEDRARVLAQAALSLERLRCPPAVPTAAEEAAPMEVERQEVDKPVQPEFEVAPQAEERPATEKHQL